MTSFLKKYWLLLSLACIMILAFGFGDDFTLPQKQVFYTISANIKGFLLFFLPFLVFPYIVTALSDMKSGGVLLVVCILLGVAISTFIAIFYGFSVASLCFPFMNLDTAAVVSERNEICALIDYSVDPFFTIEISLVVGLCFGLLLSYFKSPFWLRWMNRYRAFATFFFERIFTPLLPLYIFGLLLKLQHDTDCGNIFLTFRNLIILMVVAQVVYIALYFMIGTGGRLQRALRALKTAFPAGATAFTSISSVVTLPVTLRAAKENVKNPDIANVTIPTTVNCHALGDAIALPILALAIYYIHFQTLPDIMQFLPCALMLTLAQFGAISVAGGSVIIIIPMLIAQLNFSPEMVGLLTAIGIFLDPWGTALNVMGNSGFVMIVDRFYKKKSA